ncbi:MAG: LutB/LldF family L-lactate oxidation iron-sulfur protein [Actinomycetota bacterium]
MTPPDIGGFRQRAAAEVNGPRVAAVQRGTDRFTSHRRQAVSEYQPMDTLRDRARLIRHHTLSHLGFYLGQFASSLEQAGGRIHFAGTAEEAVEIVKAIVADGPGGPVIKSKSMVSEELELNHHLEAQGRQVVETDLGEFIIQLAGAKPVHIIAPALDRTRQEIGQLFAGSLQVPYTDDPLVLNDLARHHLRPIFLSAGVGITGVNFAVAATGSIVTVTNEGNGRLCSTTPSVHVAVMGMERLVPGPSELAVMLEILARSATGQRLSVYTNIITGPRRKGEPDGPDELHVVVVDNGRASLLGGEYEEVLACIRCGACLNVCPVYRHVGGLSYGSVYPGPVGAVLSPALFGLETHGDLPYASTLCGACLEVCPIRIDLPRMLLALRRESAAAGHLPTGVVLGLRAFDLAATSAWRWRWFWKAARAFSRPLARQGWIGSLPGPGRGWTMSRDLLAPRLVRRRR